MSAKPAITAKVNEQIKLLQAREEALLEVLHYARVDRLLFFNFPNELAFITKLLKIW